MVEFWFWNMSGHSSWNLSTTSGKTHRNRHRHLHHKHYEHWKRALAACTDTPGGCKSSWCGKQCSTVAMEQEVKGVVFFSNQVLAEAMLSLGRVHHTKVFSYGSAASTLKSQWQQSVQLLQQMHRKGLRPGWCYADHHIAIFGDRFVLTPIQILCV